MTAIKRYTFDDPHADAKRHDDDTRRADWGLPMPQCNERKRIEAELADGGWAVVGASRLVSAEEYALWAGQAGGAQ